MVGCCFFGVVGYCRVLFLDLYCWLLVVVGLGFVYYVAY